MMKKAVLIAIALGATAAYVQPALANPEKAIKARRGVMQAISFNAGPLFGMAKGKVAYDAKMAQTLANNLAALASMNNSAMWVKGTDNAAMKGKTRALPKIWEAGSEVGKASKAYKAAVAELAKVAGGGLDGLKAAVGELGKSCGGCHKPYRAKEF